MLLELIIVIFAEKKTENVAHDYGVNFAQETLVLLPQFILDAGALAVLIKNHNTE